MPTAHTTPERCSSKLKERKKYNKKLASRFQLYPVAQIQTECVSMQACTESALDALHISTEFHSQSSTEAQLLHLCLFNILQIQQCFRLQVSNLMHFVMYNLDFPMKSVLKIRK